MFFSADGMPYCHAQLRSSGGLQKVSGGSQSQRGFRQIQVCVHGHEDQLDRRQNLFDLSGCIQPVQYRHNDIEDNHFGSQIVSDRHQSTSIGCSSHDFKLGLQQFLEGFENKSMIISEHDSCGSHPLLTIGTHQGFFTLVKCEP